MWPNFDSSMINSFKYNHERQSDVEWNKLKSRYEQLDNSKDNTQTIPKIIHQIWLGGNMPDAEKSMSAAVKESLDNAWEYRLWTENDVKSLHNFTT